MAKNGLFTPSWRDQLSVTRCTICRHEHRARIELMRASGATLDAIAKRFGVNRNSLWQHWRNHVSNETKAYLIAGPAKLDELAQRAAAEQLSLLDYLSIVRSALMNLFQAATEQGSHHNAAMVSGRLLQVLSAIGRLSGELQIYATGGNTTTVTNNTMIVNSPTFARM